MTNEDLDKIKNLIADKLKDTHIKGLVQGFEVANQMLYDYAKTEGVTNNDVVKFIESNIQNKESIANIIERKNDENKTK